MLLAFVIHYVGQILFIHCCRLDVFGVLFVITFYEYFTQIGVTEMKRKCERFEKYRIAVKLTDKDPKAFVVSYF